MNAIYVPTQESILSEITRVSSQSLFAQKVITVKNTNGLLANDYIIVGTYGYEQTELCQISSIDSNTQITLKSNLKFTHEENSKIQKIEYNQVKLYRSTDNVTYSLITTKEIEVDNKSGTYIEDSTGNNTHYYKATYYNLTTLTETSQSDSDSIQISSEDVSIGDIRHEAGLDDNDYISNYIINEARLEAKQYVWERLSGRYTVPFATPYPRTLQRIIKILSAGYLMTTEYGPMVGGNDMEGQAKLKLAKEELQAYIDGKAEFIDASGSTLITNTSTGGWPDNTTESLGEDDAGGGRIFRINHKY